MALSLHSLCNLPIFSLQSNINFQVVCSQSLNITMHGFVCAAALYPFHDNSELIRGQLLDKLHKPSPVELQDVILQFLHLN